MKKKQKTTKLRRSFKKKFKKRKIFQRKNKKKKNKCQFNQIVGLSKTQKKI